MSIINIFTNSYRNYFFQKSKGFSRQKKIKGGDGETVLSCSQELVAWVLVKHAMQAGRLDNERLEILERVYGHFSEHVMYIELPTSESMKFLNEHCHAYDGFGHYKYCREVEKKITKLNLRDQLPSYVRKEIVAHLAMFQRVDKIRISDSDRRSNIRDEYGFFLGNVNNDDVDMILNAAASYVIEGKRFNDIDIPSNISEIIYPRITVLDLRKGANESYEYGWNEAEGEEEAERHIHALEVVLRIRLESAVNSPIITVDVISSLRMEALPFMFLSPNIGRRAICEYVVWREFPEQADVTLIELAMTSLKKENAIEKMELGTEEMQVLEEMPWFNSLYASTNYAECCDESQFVGIWKATSMDMSFAKGRIPSENLDEAMREMLTTNAPVFDLSAGGTAQVFGGGVMSTGSWSIDEDKNIVDVKCSDSYIKLEINGPKMTTLPDRTYTFERQ